jgi:hypothetical protein
VQQWEYMTWRVNNGSFLLTLVIGDRANQATYANLAFPDAIVLVGESGWELVAAMQAANTYTLIFKRPKDGLQRAPERRRTQPAASTGSESVDRSACVRVRRAITAVLNAVRSALATRPMADAADGALA